MLSKNNYVFFLLKKINRVLYKYLGEYKTIYVEKNKVIKNGNLLPILSNYLNTNVFMNSIIHSSFLNSNSSYFFWYFFNKDIFIDFFINITMKNGKKYLALNNIYKSFYYIKEKTSVQPLLIIKKFLCKHRVIYDMIEQFRHKKIEYIPKLSSLRSQITRTLRYMFNDFVFKKIETTLLKKNVPFYKKISYIMLNSVFNLSKIRKMLKIDRKTMRFHFHHVKKEEFFNKFLNKLEDIYRRKFFKIRPKSVDKKGKYLKKRKSFFKHYREKEYLYKRKLTKKYELNVLARFQIKTKWT